MNLAPSVRFFDAQFQQQIRDGSFELNPFEVAALPFLRGRVLDFGCGLGNLAIAAARGGCSVLALDGSPTAVERLRHAASTLALPIEVGEADLRTYEIAQDFDTIVSIGLLMFFDCATAFRRLADLQSRVRPGGTAIVNVLVEGTTYLDMFDMGSHCLFARDEMLRRFAGWDVLHAEFQTFPAPKGSVKSFVTLVARKPQASRPSA